MKKTKVIGLALLGMTGYLLTNKPKATPKNTGGGFTPITTGPDSLPSSGEDGNTAVSGFEFLKDAVEFSQEQYANMRRAEWRIVLDTKLAQGKSLAIATQEVWELWDNPGNEKRLLFNSPVALLMGMIVKPIIKGISAAPVIYWYSDPLYDTASNAWYGNYVPWTCADWKAWHIKLEEHYKNTAQANIVWEQAWAAPDNQCWFLGQVGCPDTSYCRYDCAFVAYLKSKGIDVGNIVSHTTCNLSAVVIDIVEAASNVSTGLNNTSKAMKWGIPLAAGVLGYAWVSSTSKRIQKQ